MRVYGVSFKGLMVTLSHPYRRLASQEGDDQGWAHGAVRDQSGRSVEVERPFPAHCCVSLKCLMVTLSHPYRTLASQGGEARVISRDRSRSKWSFC